MKNKIIITALLQYFSLLLVAQNVQFSSTVINSGTTSTVTIKAVGTSNTGNSLMGFTTYLYYDNTKATVASFDASAITGGGNNWGTANQSQILHQVESNPLVTSVHTGYFFYQNFDNNFIGMNVPMGTSVTLLTVTFNINSGNGGNIFLAGTAQVPSMVYSDNTANGYPVVVTGLQSQALPINLLAFDVFSKSKSIEVNWESENEKQFDFYEIERSEKDTKFVIIGKEKGKNRDIRNQYSFIDNDVEFEKDYYYRLKIVDIDGYFEYSPIKIGKITDNQSNISLFPNPSLGELNIQVTSTEPADAELIVTNMLGKVMLQQKVFLQSKIFQSRVDISSLPAGTYQLSVIVENRIVKNMKFTKL